eukprot:g16821.t1
MWLLRLAFVAVEGDRNYVAWAANMIRRGVSVSPSIRGASSSKNPKAEDSQPRENSLRKNSARKSLIRNANAAADKTPASEVDSSSSEQPQSSFLHKELARDLLAPSTIHLASNSSIFSAVDSSSLLEEVAATTSRNKNNAGKQEKQKQSQKAEKKWYCPSPEDYVPYGPTSKLQDPESPDWGAGWTMGGGQGLGVVSNKWTLDLTGGQIWVDGIDYSAVKDGVNTNIYLTSPQGFDRAEASHGHINACDSGGNHGQPDQCMEMDIYEGTGGKGYCATWHDEWEGGGAGCSGPGQGGGRKMLEAARSLLLLARGPLQRQRQFLRMLPLQDLKQDQLLRGDP